MSIRTITYITVAVLLLRLVSLGSYPLMDKTEARYGEISRVMSETGNWVTPQLEPGVPFWGKPPLAFWSSALAFKSLSTNEFAARLPHFLFGLLVLLLVYQFAKSQIDINERIWSTVLTATSVPFLIIVGGVMTDGALLFAVTLSLVSFWNAQSNEKKNDNYWRYLFFVGIGLGMLAKGPISLILIGAPISLWMVLSKERVIDVLAKFPWIIGIILAALICVPWYYIAEQKTPGCVEYCYVGEHW